MTFKQFVAELFDKSAKSHNVKDHGMDGGVWSFRIGEREYRVSINFTKINHFTNKHVLANAAVNAEGGFYNIAFSAVVKNAFGKPKQEFGLVPGSDSIKVFASVIKIIKDYFRGKGPQPLVFSAKEPSRVKLYQKFAKAVDPHYVQFTKYNEDEDIEFVMTADFK